MQCWPIISHQSSKVEKESLSGYRKQLLFPKDTNRHLHHRPQAKKNTPLSHMYDPTIGSNFSNLRIQEQWNTQEFGVEMPGA